MNEQDLIQLFPIADEVIEEAYPTLAAERPDYYEGIIAILVENLLTADLATITDEEIKEQMTTNLNNFRKMLA